jgi:hypothetical protein
MGAVLGRESVGINSFDTFKAYSLVIPGRRGRESATAMLYVRLQRNWIKRKGDGHKCAVPKLWLFIIDIRHLYCLEYKPPKPV